MVQKKTLKSSKKLSTKKTTSRKSKKTVKKSVSKFSNQDNITIGLRDPWMSLVKAGLKTIEGRLDHGIFRKIKVGNTITWKNSQDQVETKVVRVTKYNTFADMCYKEKYWRVIPGAPSFKCALDVYHKIFRKQQEARYGVVALELEVQKGK